jgi:hypothetical protein
VAADGKRLQALATQQGEQASAQRAALMLRLTELEVLQDALAALARLGGSGVGSQQGRPAQRKRTRGR